MALKSKPPKFSDEEIVISTTGFASGNDVVSRGTRLRGNHRLVQLFPDHFVPDGTPQDEWPSVFDHVLANPVEHSSEFHKVKPLEMVRIPDVVQASTGFMLVATGRRVKQGDLYHAADPFVAAHAGYFRPLELAKDTS